MRTRLLIVPALLAAAAGIAHTQPAPPALTPSPPSLPTVPSVLLPDVGQPVTERSVNQLLDQLEGLRTRKADLERQEQELVKEIRVVA